MAALFPRRDELFVDGIDGPRLAPRARRLLGAAALILMGLASGALVGAAGLPAAVVCVAALACVFVMRDFRVGVGLLILIMPISQSNLFPHEMFGVTGMNPLNLLLLVTLVSLFMRSLADEGWKHFVPRALVLLYLPPLVMGAAIGMFHVEEIPKIFHDLDLIFYTNAVGYVRDQLLKPLAFVVYALLVGAAIERSDRPERFISPFTASTIVMGLTAILFVATAGVSISEIAGTYARSFFSAIGMHANDLGRLYATAYALLLFVWDSTESRSRKWVLAIAMFLVCVALVLTFSRGAFFGFVIVNIIYLFSRLNWKRIVTALLLLPVAAWLAPGALWSRVTMGVGQGANEITAGRTNEIWAPLLPELFKSPVWGDGLGSILWSNAMIEGRLPPVAHPHNAYLQAFMDMGAIGLLMLIAFWAYCWARLWKLSRDERVGPELRGFFEGGAAGVVAFLAAGFAGSSLAPEASQSFLWLAVGVMFGVRYRLKQLPA